MATFPFYNTELEELDLKNKNALQIRSIHMPVSGMSHRGEGTLHDKLASLPAVKVS